MLVCYICGWLIPNSNEDNDADESVLWLLCSDVTMIGVPGWQIVCRMSWLQSCTLLGGYGIDWTTF